MNLKKVFGLMKRKRNPAIEKEFVCQFEFLK